VQRIAFAYFLRRTGHRAAEQPALDGVAGSLQACHKRRTTGKQRRKGSRELRNLKFQDGFADEGQAEFHAVHGNAAFFRPRPGEKPNSNQKECPDRAEHSIPVIHGETDEDFGGRRQRDFHVLIEEREFRNDYGHEVGYDNRRDANQEGR